MRMAVSSIRTQFNNALGNMIPGLQTMDPPPELEAREGDSNQDVVVIDMPDSEGRYPSSNSSRGGAEGSRRGAAAGAGGSSAMGEAETEGDREQNRGRGSLADANFSNYLSEGVAELLIFVLILACKLAYDHRLGLTVFLGLIGTFVHHSSSVKREIELKEKRSVLSLVMRLALLLVNIIFIYYVLEEQELYKCLIFLPPHIDVMTLWAVFWCVGITDFVIKYTTLILKCLVTLLPGSVLSFKKRGKIYRFLEETSQMYRLLPPFPMWLSYFSDYSESHWVISYILTIAYVILKAFTVYRKQKDLRKSLQDICIDVQYGMPPSQDQIRRVGEACPICQDDFQSPIQLTCKHIFCEDCVAMWFDREQTCPMCRAQIAASPIWRDGSTAMSVQLF